MKFSEIKAEAERTLKYKRQCDCGVNDQKRILALVAVAEAAIEDGGHSGVPGVCEKWGYWGYDLGKPCPYCAALNKLEAL